MERRGRCCKVKQVCSELRRKVDEESGMWRWQDRDVVGVR